MRAAFVNLGCKVNHAETQDYELALLQQGSELAAQDVADVIIINTCTVTAEAERKTRKAVRHALAVNPQAQVLVTGCSVAINAPWYEALDARVRVIQKIDMPFALSTLGSAAVAAGADLAFGAKPACLSAEKGNADAQDEATFDCLPCSETPFTSDPGLFRSRREVRVQDGCDNACTFCIVHVARGRARSLPRDAVLARARQVLADGCHELVLTGINIGSYHDDAGGLASLVRDMLALPAREAFRVRLGSIEPTDVDDDIIALLKESEGNVCRHLHIPVQAGSTKVLREMHRPYTAEWYGELAARLRDEVPAISLTTDCLVGFPGETEAEFGESLSLAREAGFSKIHVFPYSQRPGTPAAERADQVPPEVKAYRARILRQLSDSLRLKDFARRVGTTELVLVEGHALATTESYHRIAVPASWRVGDLCACTLTADQLKE